jgi:hypothetical protein
LTGGGALAGAVMGRAPSIAPVTPVQLEKRRKLSYVSW